MKTKKEEQKGRKIHSYPRRKGRKNMKRIVGKGRRRGEREEDAGQRGKRKRINNEEER